MKKKYKLTILFLLAIFVFQINPSQTKADLKKGDWIGIYKTSSDELSTNISYAQEEGGASATYKAYRYEADANIGKRFVAFCADPASARVQDNKVIRIYPQYGDEWSDWVKALDAGALTILKTGCSNYGCNYNGIGENQTYLATTIAFRLYIRYSKVETAINGDWDHLMHHAFRMEADNYIKNNFSVSYFWPDYNDEDAKNIYQASKDIFLAGKKVYDELNAALENTDKDETTKNVEPLKVFKQVNIKKQDDKYIEEISYTFDFKSYPTDQYVYVSLESTSNKFFQYSSLELCDRNNNCQPINNKTDITKFNDKDGNGQAIIKFNVTKTPDEDESCLPNTYKLNYTEGKKDGSKLDEIDSEYSLVWVYDDSQCSGSGQSRTCPQRFAFIISKDDLNSGNNNGGDKNGKTTTLEGTVECVDSEPCETVIELPICSEDPTESTVEITAPKNVKKCIINRKDDADNSYQLTTDNGGVSNDYCKIFCKEDYAEKRFNSRTTKGKIELQGVIPDIDCGGYFQLKANITGSKDCYTGPNENYMTKDRSINIEKFEEDIKKAQDEMIDAYNIYSFWKAAADKKSTHDKNDASHGGCSGCSGPDPCTPWSCGAVSQSGDVVTKEWTFTVYGFDGRVSPNQTTYTSLDGGKYESSYKDGIPASCRCCGCSGYVGRDPDGDHVKNANAALATLNEKIATFNKILKDYNSCTTGWIENFNFIFEQEIEWEYSVFQGGATGIGNLDFNKTYFNLINAGVDNKLVPKKADPHDGNVEINICTGNVTNNEYTNCENGWKNNVNDAIVKKSYIVCSSAGCQEELKDTSQAKFIWVNQSASQDYESESLYYQTYPTGNVGNKTAYEKVQASNPLSAGSVQMAPIDGLAVPSSLVGGGIYVLKVRNLGEFYDVPNKTGRLIDFNGKNEKESIAKKVGVSNKDANVDEEAMWNGEYYCNYLSPCIDEECPNCIFRCRNKNADGSKKPYVCEWDEVCPDCDVISRCSKQVCLFDEGKLNVSVKTISTTSLKGQITGSGSGSTALRTFGHNWNVNSNVGFLQLIVAKASATLNEIEEDNTNIYSEDYGSNPKDHGKAFTIELNSKAIKTIKDYNEQQNGKGGYANDSLTCYDATINGKTYNGIYCYSDLIDKLVDSGAKMTIAGKDIKSIRPTNKNDRENNTTGYFELWEGYTYRYKEPSTDPKDVVNGGPSWK